MIKKVLILSDRNFQSAPRIIREIFILEKSFKVFTSNFISYRDNHIYRKKSPLLLLDRIFNKLYKLFKGHYYYKNLPFRSIFLARFYKKYLFDLIIIHEPELLPYVDFLKKKFQVKVVFNAHEYHPLEFENDLIWKKKYGKQYEYLYYNYLKKLDLLVNVCDGIAFECKRSFNVSSIVVPNASFYHNVEVKEVQENFKVIHHGACIRSRQIEGMIEAMDGLPNIYFDLMLTPNDPAYYIELENLCQHSTNVRLIPTVPFDDIIRIISSYDIGLFLLPPVNFNYTYALPNKFFEFIQARLCIAIGPSEEMKKIVETYNIGIISEDFSAYSLKKVFLSLDKDQILKYKTNCNIAARFTSADIYYQKYLESINKMCL